MLEKGITTWRMEAKARMHVSVCVVRVCMCVCSARVHVCECVCVCVREREREMERGREILQLLLKIDRNLSERGEVPYVIYHSQQTKLSLQSFYLTRIK